MFPGETLTLDYELNEPGTDESEIKWELVKDENGTEKTTDLTADENSNNKKYTVKKSDAGGKIRVTVTPKIDNKTGDAEKAETKTVSEKLVTFKKEPVFTIEGGDLAYPKPGNKLTVTYELDKAAGEADESVITWTRVKDGQTTELTADANSDGKTYTVAEADVESKIKVSVTPKTDNEYVSDGETKDFISNEVKEAGFEPQKAYNMSLKASDIPSETYTSAFVKNGFTIHAGTNEDSLYRSVTVEGNNKKINDTSYSARLKMNGPGAKEYRSVSFTAVKEAKLAIACMSSNDSNSAKLKIATESGAEYTGTYKFVFGEEAAALTEKYYTAGGIVINNKLNNAPKAAGTYIELTLPAGTYYLYSDSAPAVNFYEIKVTYTDGGADHGESDYATVRFDKNGGVNDIASQKILKGENCPKPAGPIRDGYKFKGWYTDAAGTAAYDFDQAVNADLTLYAAWEEDTTAECLVLDMKDLPLGDYTSTFDYRGFTFAASDDKGLSVGASSATVKGKAYTQVLKLNGTGDSTCRNLSFTTTEVSTVTIVAVSGNDRDLALKNGSDIKTKTINAADEYVFSDVPAGTWYLYSMNNGINIYYISVKPATVEITPTILDEDNLLNGEEVYFVSGTEEKKVTSGTTLDLKKNQEYKLEVRDGDTVSPDLKAKIDGSTTYIPTEDDSVDIIITEASETVTITFMNGNDIIFEDEVEMFDPKEGVLYELALVESKVNVPEGKEFLGWDLSSDAKATVYYPAGYIHFHENVTLYAVIADIDAITYTVTFEDQYGDEIDATFVLEGGTITFDETYNEYENYVFAGWKLKGDKDPNKVYAVGETYAVTGDVTFVETWKLREYTVTLTDENGNVMKTQKVEAGKEFTFPETAPTKAGYTFAGWKTEYDDSAYGTGSKCVITEDVTFRETWAQPNDKEFTVTFKDEFDNEITELKKTIAAGDPPVITLPEKTPTERIGYKFVGWYDYWDGDFHKPGTTYTVTKNVVLFEYWEEEDYESGMYFRLDDEEAYYQGGAAITPPVEVYYNGESLTLGTDYTVKYKNNKNAGEATLTITGKSNFAGAKKEEKFKIRQADIEGWTDYAGAMTVIKNAKVNPVITYNGKQLKLGKDFTISGAGLENGKYISVTGNDADGKPIPNKLTVEGINNFTGTFDIEVIVVEKNGAPSLAVEIDRNFRPVYGEEVLDWATLFGETEIVDGQLVVTAPGKITVYEKGDRDKKPLAFSTYKGIQSDFEVVMVSGDFYSAGTQKFMIVGRGKYTGTVTKSFKILPKPLDEDDIQVGVYEGYDFKTTDLTAEYSSTGSTLEGLTVRYTTGYRYNDIADRNYKVSYSNNKKVGTNTAKVKITFLNDYKGTKPQTATFSITGASLNNTYAIAPDMVYSKEGKSYVSKPLVEYNGAILKASEYTVSYAWATETQCKDENGNRKADEDIHWTPVEGNRVNITLEDKDQYARVKVMITPSAKSNFILTDKDYETGKYFPKTTYYYVRKADPEKAFDLSKAKVEFFADANCSQDEQYKKIPYCGEKFYTPEGNKVSNVDGIGAVFVKVTVKVGREDQIVDPSLYDVTWLNATNKGKATVVIVGKGPDYVDEEDIFA
nr:InlB B-repeat-containing protein [Lachnospiraceae bacterium]